MSLVVLNNVAYNTSNILLLGGVYFEPVEGRREVLDVSPTEVLNAPVHSSNTPVTLDTIRGELAISKDDILRVTPMGDRCIVEYLDERIGTVIAKHTLAEVVFMVNTVDRYTDAEARSACNLGGTLYWSCPGIAFDAGYPYTNVIIKATAGYVQANADNIIFTEQVNLPNGATVIGTAVYGNAAAEDEIWTLVRIAHANAVLNSLAAAAINTEDTTIDNKLVDNSAHSYYFYTSSLDTNDQIYGARITYTL